jgi:hypothetical protein
MTEILNKIFDLGKKPRKTKGVANEEPSPTLNTLLNNSKGRYVTIKDQGLDISLAIFFKKTFSK